MTDITHDFLVAKAAYWLENSRKCYIVISEKGIADEIPDSIGFGPRGWSILVECKVSKSDFYADKKKPSRQGKPGLGQERWYLTPPGLLNTDSLPEGWGLLEYRTTKGKRTYLKRIKDADTHNNKILSDRLVKEHRLLLNEVLRIKWRCLARHEDINPESWKYDEKIGSYEG